MSRRADRWWRPATTRRPGVRARVTARPTRAGGADLDGVIRTSMQVGEMQGRKWGERDTYRRLALLLDNPTELLAEVGGRAILDQADDFLLIELARRADPEGFHRLTEAVASDDPDALGELMREWGIDEEGDEQ